MNAPWPPPTRPMRSLRFKSPLVMRTSCCLDALVLLANARLLARCPGKMSTTWNRVAKRVTMQAVGTYLLLEECNHVGCQPAAAFVLDGWWPGLGPGVWRTVARFARPCRGH